MGPYKGKRGEAGEYSLGAQRVKYLEVQDWRKRMHGWVEDNASRMIRNECPDIDMAPLYETEGIGGHLSNQMRLYEKERGITMSVSTIAAMSPEELTSFLNRPNIGEKSISHLKETLSKYGLGMERAKGKSGKKQWTIVE